MTAAPMGPAGLQISLLSLCAWATVVGLACGIVAYAVALGLDFRKSRQPELMLRSLEKPLFAIFFVAAFLWGAHDYDSFAFFVWLGLFTALPFVLATVAILTPAFWALSGPLRRNWLLATLIGSSVTGLLIFYINVAFPSGIGGEFLRAITRNEFYGVLCVALPLLLGCFVVFVPPAWAIIRGTRLLQLDRVAAYRYFAIPLAAIALFYVGRAIADFAAVETIGPLIQAAIRDAGNGKTLPAMSQSYPIAVFKKGDVAAYSLGGPLFLVTYIVFERSDARSPKASAQAAKLLDGGACSVNARHIGEHYYLVTEAC